MCGIAGLIGGDEKTIREMTSSLSHRGPDDEGFLQSGPIWLGHRRLSIIDLDGGHQPMMSSDGKIAVVFNGEIYNFKELRKELEYKYRFGTVSDTEVIVHGYEEWGDKVFERLTGMFAIAIWDGRTDELFIARDRMGEKPLYYFSDGHFFTFASELKALLKNNGVPREIDNESLVRYLVFGHVPSPYTIFKNIRKLNAGEQLRWNNGHIVIRRYWSIRFDPVRPVLRREIENELERRLNEAVRQAMVADVPVGVFLSGGLDSSLVAYFAKKYEPDLKTFSIGFRERSFDESPYAAIAARHLKTDHFSKIVSSDDVIRLAPQMANFTDEPFADVSILPTFLLCQFAQNEIKVALGGDGGDEIFAGYQTFIAEKIWKSMRPLLPAARFAAHGFLSILPSSGRYMSLDFKLRRFFSSEHPDAVLRHCEWLSHIHPRELSKILGPNIVSAADAGDVIGKTTEQTNCSLGVESDWGRILGFYRKFYLGDQVLTKVDRASMANSLEVRSPFLNHALVEYAASLPIDMHLSGFTIKSLLRRIAKRHLPEILVKRKKQGFAVPMGQWLRSELYEFGCAKLTALKQSGWIDPEGVDVLWREHQKRAVDRRMELWNLIALELWRERWLK